MKFQSSAGGNPDFSAPFVKEAIFSLAYFGLLC
jgi:hypothetical protein